MGRGVKQVQRRYRDGARKRMLWMSRYKVHKVCRREESQINQTYHTILIQIHRVDTMHSIDNYEVGTYF